MARGTGGGSGFGQPGAIIQLLHLLTLRSYIQTCLKKLNVISFSEAGQNENHLSKIFLLQAEDRNAKITKVLMETPCKILGLLR